MRVSQSLANLRAGFALAQVELGKVDQVAGAGFHAIGFIAEHAGVKPDRCILLVVALGIQRHFAGGHGVVGVVQPQCREQLLLHCLGERQVQAFGGNHAEHADAWIGVAALGAHRVGGFPAFEVIHQLALVLHAVRQLQREAACSMGGQMGQGYLAKGRAFKFRLVFTDGIAQ